MLTSSFPLSVVIGARSKLAQLSNIMGKKVSPPSRTEPLSFPVFGLTWHGVPSSTTNSSSSSSNDDDGCSVIAYCGGGGSGRHGVGNAIVVLVTTPPPPVIASAGDDGRPHQPQQQQQRRITISTGTKTCFHVRAFQPSDDGLAAPVVASPGGKTMARVLACVHDEVLLYGIPLGMIITEGGEGSINDDANGSNDGEVVGTKKRGKAGQETMMEVSKEGKEYLLLGSVTVGTSRGANVATYISRYINGQIIHLVAVGCEDGTVIVYQMILSQKQQQQQLLQRQPSSCYEFVKIVECHGHEKAVCSITFHPRGSHVLTSAKDGTARIFSVDTNNATTASASTITTTTKDVACLTCEIHDPNGPPPPPPPISTSTDVRMMKRPPQIIVRGSYFADLEGKVIYTIASGKRGPTYLTKWNVIYGDTNVNGVGGGDDGSNNNNIMVVELVYRKQCSNVPISSTSLSMDGSILTMGSVEGSILLYSLETNVLIKEFKDVHDMPVTCVASRPIPMELMLPGEFESGVNYNAISASADNKLGFWTVQRKSRLCPPSRTKRTKGPWENYIMELLHIPLLILLGIVLIAIRDTCIVCGDKFTLLALLSNDGLSNAGRCLFREVLWAEELRVSFVPE